MTTTTNTSAVAADLFSKGCLVKLETSVWTARCKIPSKALLKDREDVDPRSVAASKRLIDGKALADIEAVRNEARAYLYSQSLPFPLDGAVFVPIAQVEKINEKLREYQAKFDELTAAFVEAYPQLREAARTMLGSLYSEADYPHRVTDKFGFGWRFFTLSPASEAQLLSPTLVAEERAKFQALMGQAAEAATTELRTRFAACVDHMVERLAGTDDGKPKIFRDSLVGNLKEFFDAFESLNILDDKALKAQVEKARKAIKGVDAEALRTNEATRAHVVAQMAAVQAKLDDMIVDRPTRKLRLPSASKAA